jgi:hypothetical protein
MAGRAAPQPLTHQAREDDAHRLRRIDFAPSRLLKKGRLPLTLNCESDSYANEWMAGGIDARIGYADG